MSEDRNSEHPDKSFQDAWDQKETPGERIERLEGLASALATLFDSPSVLVDPDQEYPE